MIPSDSLRHEILEYSLNKYNTKPIYPWTLLPEYAVLRHESSLKWYALFMNVDGQRLGLTPGRIYDVIDLRCREEDISSYLGKKGFLPAYHMSKKDWITILLDGSVDLEKIIELLDISFEITRDHKDLSSSSEYNKSFDISNDSKYNRSFCADKNYDYNISKDIDIPAKVTFTGTYKDQPLSFGGRRRADESLPPMIAQMKELYNVLDSKPGADGYYFYKQGKFMEDYEEPYDFHGRFTRYFPTYHVMNNDQLQGYFDFRRRFRNGEIDAYSLSGSSITSLSFIYVYLYEILCNIGISDPEEGFRKLLYIDEVFGDKDPSMHEYIQDWLKDYVVYYNLPESLIDGVYDKSFDDSLSTILTYENYIRDIKDDKISSPSENIINDNKTSKDPGVGLSEDDVHKIFEAIDALSSYSLKGSLFYKKNPKDMEEVTVRAYRNVSLFYQEHNKPMLLEKCFGAKGVYPYHMFRKAIFYDHIHYEDYEYVFSDARIYRCRDGHWSLETFYKADSKSSDLGAICKEIDRICRRKFSFGHPLQQKLNLPLIIQAISDAADTYIKEKEEAAKPKIHIDFGKLSGIRKDAAYTRDQLITEEEMSDEDEFMKFEDEVSVDNETKAGSNNNASVYDYKLQPSENDNNIKDDITEDDISKDYILKGDVFNDQASNDNDANNKAVSNDQPSGNLLISEHQMNIVNLLLAGGNVIEYAASNHLMLAIEIDAINEALYDEIGDTVIEFDGDTPELVEDYIDDIKQILGIR
ncbi:MAG: TerB N-terminal domain-containing protein [Butyrivibrio sp.]|jgi:predicted DNA-binding protein (MmcQ/YjbR family)|uniref:TerB N-terminal domain-containing protein n=1 Tax=Butyrivibrio sp. TaxID=28121 RepID=UPI0025BF6310|nr:TerB N-terminal domain-containing protein [Butyrivibrio sp.]MCR5771904.1 TerB N-terminal domain-containing protein [Butyrivibrio sp.]